MTSMTLCFLDGVRKPTRLRPAHPAVAIGAALIILLAAGDHAAAGRRNESAVEAVDSRAAGAPVMAIVSLHSQRITVYDASGWILRAPVSSGQTGRETPAGIFSVIGKEVEHYSNLYDDAFMPHMQRITWSGIALHGGPLPGYPASHGCIRMPYDFAERLFGETKLGMRVIVAPTDAAPVEIAHPNLFSPKPGAGAAARAAQAEAEEAARKAEHAKLTALATSRDAAQASMSVRAAERLKRKADAQLAAAERKLTSAGSAEAQQQAEDARARAAAQVAEAEAQVVAARTELQSKLDAAASARQAAAEAETMRVAAAEAARNAARGLEPASVFISRKTQRLYVRQAFQPILDVPVTIQDADRPIGTHVFTAMERIGDAPDMRWSVVSLVSEPPDGPRGAAPDGANAKAALDRIVIPQDALDRIAGMVSPRSSLIVSDEALSDETGKATDFIVLMSGEPQGGIKFRRHNAHSRDRLPYRYTPFAVRSPFTGPW
jgi:hypothetical protein